MKLTFGKYKGSEIYEVPRDYLTWIIRKGPKIPGPQEQAIKKFLGLPYADIKQSYSPSRFIEPQAQTIQINIESEVEFRLKVIGFTPAQIKTIVEGATIRGLTANDITRAIDKSNDCKEAFKIHLQAMMS